MKWQNLRPIDHRFIASCKQIISELKEAIQENAKRAVNELVKVFEPKEGTGEGQAIEGKQMLLKGNPPERSRSGHVETIAKENPPEKVIPQRAKIKTIAKLMLLKEKLPEKVFDSYWKKIRR